MLSRLFDWTPKKASMETKLGAIVIADYKRICAFEERGNALNAQMTAYRDGLEDVLEQYWADWVNETALDDDMPDAFQSWLDYTFFNDEE